MYRSTVILAILCGDTVQKKNYTIHYVFAELKIIFSLISKIKTLKFSKDSVQYLSHITASLNESTIGRVY